ncbi:hypothetical protein [Phyllobacterium myrsinacearum]|uniref:Uncharacterized protein n=1 Tax=Phyllobacterium myrsinacearum TaxID=28101 RepID=A0A839EH30_9HYPH|nr:hypothetical protein [Phyllobacterium myrsinacearum]MBA8878202.1 hypothetical protein [Phyllobacterium myrsinacearum]
MTPERFQELTEIYGADVRRWPPPEQTAAVVFIKDYPDLARPALAAAAKLDTLLSGYQIAQPDTVLREKIIAASGKSWSGWRRARLWWQGTGIAGIGLAGAITGALLIGVIHSAETRGYEDQAYAVTAFNITDEMDE